ncbi:hypothetical protein RD792_002459 [Penstemon davidsonii]|uniref:Receptor-like serine/threonine-protein kinase n=1 Tax=Penstemon davidsonii TaxID=160366 RepID=A0ABR0DS85_9LAMI|nr:hypothetical protein RD792_002459 [Penstemon davidsonii]
MASRKKLLKHFFPLLMVITFCGCSQEGLCLETDTLTATSMLNDSDTIDSSGDAFTLGFFTPHGTTRRYLGIWYHVSQTAVTWVANNENPLNDSSGRVTISPDGNIVLMNVNNEIVWSTSVSSSARNTTAQLLDSGNLVLTDSSTGSTIWESHRHPGNSFLPTMRLSQNERTNEMVVINSWRSSEDPGRGNFTSGLFKSGGIPQSYVWNNGVPYWRSGPWNGRTFNGVRRMYSVYVDGFNVVTENDTVYVTQILRRQFVSRNFIETDGVLTDAAWNFSRNDWDILWTAPNGTCDLYNYCGQFGMCYQDSRPICSCFRGYEPSNEEEWDRGNWSGGCVRKTLFQCERDNNATDKNREDGFIRLTFVKVPEFIQWSSVDENECRSQCLRNFSCVAYAYDSEIGCMFWNETLFDTHRFPGDEGSDLYVRAAYSELERTKDVKAVIIISVIGSFIAALICLFLSWLICKRNGKCMTSSANGKGETRLIDTNEISFQSEINNKELPFYSLEMLSNATNNFAIVNKLGTGGFGSVYKGKLENGQEIAVKRLSAESGQGLEEFRNEVVLISKLQHKNLVRLLGCCVDSQEKMLIYEYLQNRSLDVFLFDASQDVLDWSKRFNIIEGIGRGILYLHRDSILKIIHRDLKPSNILLDEYWNPKISDFGMARIFGGSQDQANTKRVVGTFGYMAPEYAMGGRFSEKSDIFSFGVIVLEIISGRRNTSFYNDELSLGLLGYAWKRWKEENALDLIDERIWSRKSMSGIMRCMCIGLLCVQEFPDKRPNISTVLSMLSSEIVDLSMPDHPGFMDRWTIRSRIGLSFSTKGNKITLTGLEGR